MLTPLEAFEATLAELEKIDDAFLHLGPNLILLAVTGKNDDCLEESTYSHSLNFVSAIYGMDIATDNIREPLVLPLESVKIWAGKMGLQMLDVDNLYRTAMRGLVMRSHEVARLRLHQLSNKFSVADNQFSSSQQSTLCTDLESIYFPTLEAEKWRR